ncbi:MAG: hypothetical protein IT427_12795 [Pirellulales bacterium]|nr:hypothetical protein [Pirellulales bacterium]
MSAKVKINKSEEVRKLNNSGISACSEIIAKLKARGINVAPSQVYQVLNRSKAKKAKKKPSTLSHNGTVIDTAILFVRQAGGMEKARELLGKLAMLRD